MPITLSSVRLSAVIALPGEPPNTTNRFDSAGFIIQVVLDGRHRFCTSEPTNLSHPCSGGVGLCAEFKADQLAREAAIGEPFLKPGVGIITKTSEDDYLFYKPYSPERVRVRLSQGTNMLLMKSEPQSAGGYALRSERRVAVEGTALSVRTTLENVGDKAIMLDEYNHNFVTLDQLPLGPGYRLEFRGVPAQMAPLSPEKNGTFSVEGATYSFSAYNPRAAMVHLDLSNRDAAAPFSWRLSHADMPAAVSEQVSFSPAAVAVWPSITSSRLRCLSA